MSERTFELHESAGERAGLGQNTLAGQFQIACNLDATKGIRPKIESIAQDMLQNPTRPIKVSTLCERAELSPSAFFASFKRVTGQPPIAYLTRARMRLAVKLLEETSLQIKQIAALVGYPDEFHFSKRFKSTVGLSPRHYRAAAVQKRPEVPAAPASDPS